MEVGFEIALIDNYFTRHLGVEYELFMCYILTPGTVLQIGRIPVLITLAYIEYKRHSP